MFNEKKLGEKIQAERKRLGYSLDSFAQKILTTRQTLSRWERGEGVGPSVTDLLKMCELFDCDFGYLVGEYDCRTREATDIHAKTGLSEDGILSLIELNNNDQKIKSAVFSALDVFLDWELLPMLAIRFNQYIAGELDNKDFYIMDHAGKNIGLLPNDAAFLLLQNAISDFLEFAKKDRGFSRRARRERVSGIPEAELDDLAADYENDLRRGK